MLRQAPSDSAQNTGSLRPTRSVHPLTRELTWPAVRRSTAPWSLTPPHRAAPRTQVLDIVQHLDRAMEQRVAQNGGVPFEPAVELLRCCPSHDQRDSALRGDAASDARIAQSHAAARRTAGAYSKRAAEHRENERHLDGAADLVRALVRPGLDPQVRGTPGILRRLRRRCAPRRPLRGWDLVAL
jgi:hypothetical protein